MTAQDLQTILSWVPYVEVVSAVDDGPVATLMCRIAPAKESAWELLAGKWLAQMPQDSALLVAKQLQWHGRLGYLWNVSLFSERPQEILQMMQIAVRSLDPKPQLPQAGPQPGQGLPPLQAAQKVAEHVGRSDAVTPESIEAARKSGNVVVREVPLYGASPTRNQPTGMAIGAKGRRFPSERGASSILRAT